MIENEILFCLRSLNKLAMFLLFTVLVSSCSKSDESLTSSDEHVKIVATIGNASRYAGADINNVSFDVGDRIGVFVDADNVVKWSFSLTWNPEKQVLWPDKINSHNFDAFYPFSDNATYDKVDLPDLSKQEGDIASLGKYDFMVASKSQKHSEGNVISFTNDNSFKHQCCLLYINLKSVEDLTNAVVNGVSIKSTGIANKASYSFENNKIQVSLIGENDIIALTQTNIDMLTGDKDFYLIVPTKSDSENVSLVIEYSIGDKKYTAEYNDFADNTFLKNKKQPYNISVKSNQISIDNLKVIPWDDSAKVEDIIIED